MTISPDAAVLEEYTGPVRYVTNDPIGTNANGWPIYLVEDDSGTRRFVVVTPDGRVLFTDAHGTPIPRSQSSPATLATGAVLGGLVGALFGAPDIVLGAAVGTILAWTVLDWERSGRGR